MLVSPLLVVAGSVLLAEPTLVDYGRDIQPLLNKHCVSCHGPLKQKSGFRLDQRSSALRGGDTHGVAIVPGKSQDSPLLRYVAGTDPDLVMPPKGERLSQGQVDLLRAWIDQGASWGEVSQSSEERRPSDHWAFRPVTRPKVPDVPQSAMGPPLHTAIDSFIAADLARDGLKISPQADRRSLIRRLSFDLLGLPPTPEQVEQFVTDPDPAAYEQLLDDRLASPRLGERWARHWLDVVAFGETHGFEVNTPRENAWPYRDYVIQAFNEDLPYTEFILDQLVGDTRGKDPATGFLVARAALLPGQIGRDEESIRLARQDELNDMVAGVGSTFLGLSIHCARCHDHKFDPIPQADYFALQAMLAGVRHGDRAWRTPDFDDRKARAEQLSKELAMVRRSLFDFEPIADPHASSAKSTNAKRNEDRFPPIAADLVRFTVLDANHHPTLGLIEPCLDELEVFTAEKLPRNVALASAGATLKASGSRTSERHRLEFLNDGRPGNDRSWMSDEPGRGWVEVSLAHREMIDRVVWSRDREGNFQDRLPTSYLVEVGVKEGSTVSWSRVAAGGARRSSVQPSLCVDRIQPTKAKRLRFTVLAATSLEPCIDELEVFSVNEPQVNVALASSGARARASGSWAVSPLHKLEHINDGRYGNSRSWISSEMGKGWVEIEFPQSVMINKIVWSRDREEKFSDRMPIEYRIEVADEGADWKVVSTSGDRKSYQLGVVSEPVFSAEEAIGKDQQQLQSLLQKRQRFTEEIQSLSFSPMVYAGRFEPKPETIWRLHRGDPMQRREEVVPATLTRIGQGLSLSAATPEPERREALARWIGKTRNPLTARVLVNRLWQFHFGEGLVSTPSDFGLNGAKPVNGELLDWLAAEFMARGWSVKAMHRLICQSAVYRQSSAPTVQGTSVDASTRRLWRYPPRRQESEAIRDSILAVAGSLDDRMGGPGFSVFKPNDNYVRVYDPKEDFTPKEWRRSIYMTKVRMAQDGTFGAFDCPDAGQVQPRRPRSNTAIQALNLFNSGFVWRQSERFAQRIRDDVGDAPPGIQVRLAFRLAFQRDPSTEEAGMCAEMVSSEGLTMLCRVLFNTNEFLFFH